MSRDITARKHAEVALRESEERGRTLPAYSQDIVILLMKMPVSRYASPSVTRWLGYEPRGEIGSRSAGTAPKTDTSVVADAFCVSVEP